MNKVCVDLHIHSSYSDGTDSPRLIIEKLMENGISICSITDHDSVEAYDEIMDYVKNSNRLKCIAGVEISSLFLGKNVHILGYGLTSQNADIVQICRYNRDSYDIKDRKFMHNLQDAGFQVDIEQYDLYKNDTRKGGWKALNYLIDIGICADVEEFLVRYATREFLPQAELMDSSSIIQKIQKNNGISVLAHPGEYVKNIEELMGFLELLCEMGIQGVECYSPYNSGEVTKNCVEFCKKYNLCITGGSDYHGQLNRRKRNKFTPIKIEYLDLKRIIEACR